MDAPKAVSLIDVSTYLPGSPIGADYYLQFQAQGPNSDDLRDNLMFRAPRFRHHVAPDETAIDMVERATAGLVERHGHDAIANVDVLITHTQMPDMPFYGGGGGMAHRLGMKPNWVIDLHNGGCAAFVLAMNLARKLLATGEGSSALIAIAQNAAGQAFDQETVRRKAQASVPGDGAAVGLVTNQPNRVFLRNWREALELPAERHRDTFDECGNLFAAGIPVNLDRAITDGQLNKGGVVMMAAFAHAGDFAGAAVQWGGRDG